MVLTCGMIDGSVRYAGSERLIPNYCQDFGEAFDRDEDGEEENEEEQDGRGQLYRKGLSMIRVNEMDRFCFPTITYFLLLLFNCYDFLLL